MMMCKESEGRKNEDAFVRQVNAAPYPMMCLTFDWTLHDLAQFCTNPKNFSILGVDPTFDLGDFDVTVTTYRHLMLELKGSSDPKHPVFLGPLFVHLRKNFEAYHFFASTLVSKCPELRCIQCFGTDGEEALSKALSTVFPSAEHIRFFLHFRGNIESKLHSLHIPNVVMKEFVLGNPATLELGLADAESIDKLDVMIDSLESIWNQRGKPFNSPPTFHSWFVENERDVVAHNMIRPLREKAGLGSPPQPYYTNEVESKNNILKQRVKHKKQDLPSFTEAMKRLLLEQQREIERAVAGLGEYKLVADFEHLSVTPQKWFKMNEAQRRRKVQQFFSMLLWIPHSQTQAVKHLQAVHRKKAFTIHYPPWIFFHTRRSKCGVVHSITSLIFQPSASHQVKKMPGW